MANHALPCSMRFVLQRRKHVRYVAEIGHLVIPAVFFEIARVDRLHTTSDRVDGDLVRAKSNNGAVLEVGIMNSLIFTRGVASEENPE